MSAPLSEHGYLLAPVLLVTGIKASATNSAISDAITDCGIMRLFIVRDQGDENALAGGMIEFENINAAEKAYSTIGIQTLPGSQSRLSLEHPLDPASLRLAFCPPIELLHFPLTYTKSKIYDLFRPFGRIRYVGHAPSITATGGPQNGNELMSTPRQESTDWTIQFYRIDNTYRAIEKMNQTIIEGSKVIVKELESLPLAHALNNPFHRFAPSAPLNHSIEGVPPVEGPIHGPSPSAFGDYQSCKLLSAVMQFEPVRARQIVMLLSGLPRPEFQLCILNPFYLRCKSTEAIELLLARDAAKHDEELARQRTPTLSSAFPFTPQFPFSTSPQQQQQQQQPHGYSHHQNKISHHHQHNNNNNNSSASSVTSFTSAPPHPITHHHHQSPINPAHIMGSTQSSPMTQYNPSSSSANSTPGTSVAGSPVQKFGGL